MKFGQLIEHEKYIFLKNYTQNVMEKLVPGHLSIIKTEHISRSIVGNVIKFVFIVCPSWF